MTEALLGVSQGEEGNRDHKDRTCLRDRPADRTSKQVIAEKDVRLGEVFH